MIRATVALQVATLEREDEDIGASQAVNAIEKIVKEIISLHKQMKKADQ
jgi:hypothetical protein